MNKNDVSSLKKFFGVDAKEFMEFWKSLSDEEKEYYYSADLN